MASEDIYNGAKTGLTFMHAYLNIVAQEFGMEKALALDTKTCQMLGVAQGQMIREQIGDQEIGTRKASEVLSNLIEEGFGISSEVDNESSKMITFKVGRCPVYEAAQTIGMDDEAIKAGCQAGAISFMDAVTKQLNPNLSYQLLKFRSSGDDFCEEAVVLE